MMIFLKKNCRKDIHDNMKKMDNIQSSLIKSKMSQYKRKKSRKANKNAETFWGRSNSKTDLTYLGYNHLILNNVEETDNFDHLSPSVPLYEASPHCRVLGGSQGSCREDHRTLR